MTRYKANVRARGSHDQFALRVAGSSFSRPISNRQPYDPRSNELRAESSRMLAQMAAPQVRLSPRHPTKGRACIVYNWERKYCKPMSKIKECGKGVLNSLTWRLESKWDGESPR
jgi:hypothetical protein